MYRATPRLDTSSLDAVLKACRARSLQYPIIAIVSERTPPEAAGGWTMETPQGSLRLNSERDVWPNERDCNGWDEERSEISRMVDAAWLWTGKSNAKLQRQNPAVKERTGDIDLELTEGPWLSLNRTNVRMVTRYRIGPVFLAGDPANVHSPVGGQGMNTGMQGLLQPPLRP